VPSGDEIYVLGRTGVPGPLSIYEGQRYPFAPPAGSIILAWAGEPAVQAWLDRLKDDLTDEERLRYRRAIEATRRRGYAYGVRVQRLHDLHELFAKGDMYTPEGRREIYRAQAELAHDSDYLPISDELPPGARLGHVSAPVFGPDGRMHLALALFVHDQSRAAELAELGNAVVRATGRVTAAIDGRPPPVNGRALATDA
jgi:DNA-binding IclR family transcriptional regulator